MKNTLQLRILVFISSFIIFIFFISPILIVHYLFNSFIMTLIITVLNILFILAEYRKSISHTLDSIKSKEIDLDDYEDVDKILETVSDDMDIKKPKLHVCEVGYPNAFAVGRKNNGHIFLSMTLTEILEPDEIKAVIYHEASHIKRRDMFPVIMVNDAARNIGIAIYHLTNGMDLIEHLSIIFRPLTFPISQYREYVADKSACKHSKNENIANALLKISKFNSNKHPRVEKNSLVNSLSIEKPDISNIISTHPSVKNRIKNIKNFKSDKIK